MLSFRQEVSFVILKNGNVFLDGKIKLYDIYTITEKMMNAHSLVKLPDIDEIFAIDEEIRNKTKELIKNHLREQV